MSITRITESIFRAERLLAQARDAQAIAEAERKQWLKDHPQAAKKYPPHDPLVERLDAVISELKAVWN
jgi:hypothetical protein